MSHRSKIPYKLPTTLTADAPVTINMELITKYIRLHSELLPRYNYLDNMYKGFLDIYRETPKDAWKPDNRLAANFPRYITETFTGYGYGIPIKESTADEQVNESIQTFIRANDVPDHEAELIKKCCIFGHAWEYLYQDETGRTRITNFSPRELFVVYDDTITRKALFAIRYGVHSAGSDKGVVYGEVLTPDTIYKFDNYRINEELPNPYGYIPVVEWRLNDERIGLFETVAPLVEAYSHTLGEKANDVDAFAESYLAVLGAEVKDDQVRRIRDDRFINIFGTDDADEIKDIVVEFLSKPTADATQENLLDRLEDLIFELSMVSNLSDEQFGNNTSGVSLAYKLQAMSNAALKFDNKIKKSLRKRYKVWSALSTNTTNADAWTDMEFKFTRNIPNNIAEEVSIAQNLEGIVSKETQLSVLSIVDDPQQEIETIKEEQQQAMNAFGNFEGLQEEVVE